MEINELFGLPAHPLVVHAAVVLLPLAVLATLVCAAVPGARRHYAPVASAPWWAAVIAVAATTAWSEPIKQRERTTTGAPRRQLRHDLPTQKQA